MNDASVWIVEDRPPYTSPHRARGSIFTRLGCRRGRRLITSYKCTMTSVFHLRRLLYVFLLLGFVFVGVQIVRTQLGYGYMDDVDRDARLKQIAVIMNSSNGQEWRKLSAGGQACRHPILEVWNHEIMRLIKDEGPINCAEQPDWVEIDGSTARITDHARERFGEIKCDFTDVFRSSDYSNHDGMTTQTHTEYNLEKTDTVRVYCTSQKGYTWQNTMIGVRHDQDVRDRTSWDKVPRNGLGLNVLIWGFDSLSRNMYIRKLPRTMHYLRSTLDAIEMQGYNIVGDGTPQALIPMFTGKTELELPETRKRMGDKATHVNIYPFVWNDFHNNGYVTAYLEDCSNIGTFTYRMKGFDKPPTDHYMRTFYIEASKSFNKHKKFCLGSLPRHKIMLNFVHNYFKVYRDKPKFLFGFHGELSHESFNLVGAADQDTLELLQTMNDEGHLNNTLLIVMSDHGHRFLDIRNTQQGKQEERLPMFSFVFPPWFSKQYPEAIANLRNNAQRLTSPFDIYPTLRNVLHFEGTGKGDIHNRSISLFKEVPLERTCFDAYIEPHWCACLDWQEVSLSDNTVQRGALAIVEYINKYTEESRALCDVLRLNRVQWAARLVPNKGLLNFKKNVDMDGFVPDLTGHTDVMQEMFQLKIATQPGNALFEVTLKHDIRDNSFTVRISDISRINRYASEAHCVLESQPHLGKYCHCKNPPPNEN